MTRIAKVRMTLDVILDVDMDMYDPENILEVFDEWNCGDFGSLIEEADFEIMGTVGEVDA